MKAAIVASKTASDQDVSTVAVAFALAHRKAMLRRLVVVSAIDQGIEPEETMVESLAHAWQEELDPMILADGTLGLQVSAAPDHPVESLMAYVVREYVAGNVPRSEDEFHAYQKTRTQPDPTQSEAPCRTKS